MSNTMNEPMPSEAGKAITRLVDTHGGQILRLGLQLCPTREDAEDLVQETFLRALKGWPKFKGESAPSTWLFTIAVRVCKRRGRRRAGQPRHIESLSSLLPTEDDGVIDIPSPDEGPLDSLLRSETVSAVERAIGEVPVHFRMPLVLKDLAEFSVAEVAQVLGLKEATVKTRIHRARLYLARALRQSLPKREAPPRDHSRRVCLDLLKAKQEALDHDAPFPLPGNELCSRCRSLFATLDLGKKVCHDLTQGRLPESVRRALLEDSGTTSIP